MVSQLIRALRFNEPQLMSLEVIVASLDSFMEAWTDAKYVRFALYAQQARQSLVLSTGNRN